MVTNISPKAEILLKCYLIIIIIIIIISLLSGLMLFPGKKKWHNSGHQPVFLVLQLLFLFCHFISNTFCIILAVPSKQGFTIICAFFFFFLSNASVKWACGIYQQAFPTFLVNNSYLVDYVQGSFQSVQGNSTRSCSSHILKLFLACVYTISLLY